MQTDATNKADFVFSALEKRITSGFWKVGEQMPTEEELATEFRCSRGTVGRAIARLAHERLVERRTRAGTRVIQNAPGRAAPALDLDACACIYPSVQHEAIACIVQGFQDAANAARQRVMMLTTGMDFRKEAEIIGRLGEFNVRGAVIYPVIRSPQDQVYYMQMILACPYPVVLVGVNIPGVNRLSVAMDGQHAAYTVARHLIAQGARHIGFLANYAWVPTVRDRYMGYRQALSESGLDFVSLVHQETRMTPRFDDPLEEPTQLGRAYLTRFGGVVDAVVCADDFLAHGLIRAAGEMGIDIPGRLRVTGVGGLGNLPALPAPLTTYRQPFGEAGATAFRVLRDVIAGHYSGAPEILLRGEFVRGGTT